MGKCKRRTLNTKQASMYMTREGALSAINKTFRHSGCNSEARNLISLFGFSAEELCESGMAWEDLKTVLPLIN